MPALARRKWVPAAAEDLVQRVAEETRTRSASATDAELTLLVNANRTIHERETINLNPATNVMNPRAEAVLGKGLGNRPSLGYPGDKYEMGLEAIERIEIIAAELAAEVFSARFAEIRVGSGALANLYAFMATAKPGDSIIAQPPEIAGHVTHHKTGCAGLYGLSTHFAPIDASTYTLDLAALDKLARDVKPKLITLGGSLNLNPHPVAEVRAIADRVGAKVLYDAAHLSGPIAGRAWQQPLELGAHMLTMSTYKSLGGPPSGLILTNDAELAQRLDAIAYPGLTANFDAAKSASLAITLLDWKEFGAAYAARMVGTARALAEALEREGMPVFKTRHGATQSHQLAIDARGFGGGQAMSKHLRKANLLACGIGLPGAPVDGDTNGLRLGSNEIVRWGMGPEDMGELARFIARAFLAQEPVERIGAEVRAFRSRFQRLHFMRGVDGS